MGLFDFLNKKKEWRGDKILELERSRQGDLDFMATMEYLRVDGVTNEDVRVWWNMPDEQHEQLISEDDVYKVTAFKALLDEGLSKEKALIKLKKGFPIYGNPIPGHLPLADGPLPYELKPRINNYINSLSDKERKDFKNEAEKFSSMNAFLRRKIKRKEI